LLDPCGGRADLTRRRLRVLHDRSFVDDPTRLLRAARYAARLGFGLERRTRRLAEAAVRDGCLDTVSGDRIRRELMMLLGEPRAAVGVKLLARVGVLRCVHPALAIGADTTRALRIARQLCARLSGKGADANASCAVVRLLIIADGLRPDQVRALADRLRLTAAQRKALVDYARVKTQARRALAAATASNSAVVRALEGLPQETVLAIGATSSPAVRRRCELFLGELKQVRARITGKDLAQLGHAPAPAWRHALAAARDARLDGCARTKAQELRVATEILGSGSQARAPVPQAKADVV
jgi:tRNA nucleotidyltransferase (CCA-adding enzyme)